MESIDFANPWFWAILGVALLVLEIFTQVFVMLFFGVAGLVVAIAAWKFGLGGLAYQIVAFAGVGTLGLLAFRKRLLDNFRRGSTEFQADRDRYVVLDSAIEGRGQGRVQYQGSPWTAVNLSDAVLAAGSRAVIVRIEGNQVFIQPSAR